MLKLRVLLNDKGIKFKSLTTWLKWPKDQIKSFIKWQRDQI